jgi:phosphoglycolate phosphatase-like HAD superfamily hydrolase
MFSGVQAVLFDLDGTFADTAPDMARAINQVRAEKHLAKVPLEKLRPHVSMGARGMVGAAFGFTPEDKEFAPLRDQFLSHYERSICIETILFNGIPQLVSILEQRGIAWGIVTNKATRYTLPLAKALGFDITAACVVCGDTPTRRQSHPNRTGKLFIRRRRSPRYSGRQFSQHARRGCELRLSRWQRSRHVERCCIDQRTDGINGVALVRT